MAHISAWEDQRKFTKCGALVRITINYRKWKATMKSTKPKLQISIWISIGDQKSPENLTCKALWMFSAMLTSPNALRMGLLKWHCYHCCWLKFNWLKGRNELMSLTVYGLVTPLEQKNNQTNSQIKNCTAFVSCRYVCASYISYHIIISDLYQYYQSNISYYYSYQQITTPLHLLDLQCLWMDSRQLHNLAMKQLSNQI